MRTLSSKASNLTDFEMRQMFAKSREKIATILRDIAEAEKANKIATEKSAALREHAKHVIRECIKIAVVRRKLGLSEHFAPKLAAWTNKKADWIPSFDPEERSWGGAVRDNLLATGIGLGANAATEMVGLSALGPWHTHKSLLASEPVRKGLLDYLNNKGIQPYLNIGTLANTQYDPHAIANGGGYAAFDKMPGRKMDWRLGSYRKDPEVFAHETGHLANWNTLYKCLSKVVGEDRAANIMRHYVVNSSRLHRLHVRNIPLPAPGLPGLVGIGAGMISDKDSMLGNAAWTLPWIGSTPKLLEEGLASARGLNALRKTQSLAAALKGTPRMLGAFGTYASLPAAASLIAYLANRWKPSNS